MESVIRCSEPLPGVVCIHMEDRGNKNTFSEALVKGLTEVFEVIKINLSYKAVILTGYDSYFASGGTREALLFLHEGKGQFTDTNIYSLPLECPVPVISAMQGHGIGGGFVMGLFADFVVLSRESIYTTNFMKYGFTPGMGATLIVPAKLGLALGEEMLLMADTYRGEHLQQRGISFPVVSRDEVFKRACEIAKQLTEKPRASLVILKKHLTATLRQQLPLVVEKELEMHTATFHQPEVKELIEQRFNSMK